jgi:hypothetical protein
VRWRAASTAPSTLCRHAATRRRRTGRRTRRWWV